MTAELERPAASLAVCGDIAERLTPELGNSLRWLATYPGSGAMLTIEGFVRDGELVLVADMPGGSDLDPSQDASGRHDPAWEDDDSRRSRARHRLLSFSVLLVPEGPES